jgi:transposase
MLAGAPPSPSPRRTRTPGYPNQRAHPGAHQEHVRTLTHKTDRNHARGLAHLARLGSLARAYEVAISARPPLADHARKELGGQRATLESQIRGMAAVLENTIRRFRSPAVRK